MLDDLYLKEQALYLSNPNTPNYTYCNDYTIYNSQYIFIFIIILIELVI